VARVGNTGTVKCLQVEDATCITGGSDGSIRIWDLEKAEEEEAVRAAQQAAGKTEKLESEGGNADEAKEKDDACTAVLEGHTREVTALYFDRNCLVRGSTILFSAITQLWELMAHNLQTTGYRLVRQDT
jgi:division protein 1